MPKINQEEYEILKKLDVRWKWVARDNNNKLWIYAKKPRKDTCTWQISGLGATRVDTNLFQFIQWEDEEPYSIAELIEEYEEHEFYDYVGWEYYKKGKAEVKKDIDWLKREIHKELETWHGVEGGIDGDGINEIMLLINQHEESEVKRLDRKMKELESYNDELVRDNNQFRNELDNQKVLSEDWITENSVEGDFRGVQEFWYGEFIEKEKVQNLLVPKQEVLSQKWIDNNSVYASSNGITEEYVHVDDLKELLVPKQDEREILELAYKDILERSEFWFDDKRYVVVEKPTIPEFVADFLDGKEGYALYELFDNDFIYDSHDELARWLYDNDEDTNNKREFSLVLAHIYDYEVEMEQKYYVINNDNRMMLVRMMDGKTITEADPFKLEDMYEGEKESHRLTEKEIKDYDERYWSFRKPVEEMEE